MILAREKSRIERVGWIFDYPRPGFDVNHAANVLSLFLKSSLNTGTFTIEPIRIVNYSGIRKFLRRLFQKKSDSDVLAVPDEETNETYDERTVLRNEILPTKIFNWGGASDKELAYYLSCYIRLNHIDLLVIPNELKRGTFQNLSMSFPALVSREAKIPVLVLGDTYRPTSPIKDILFPVIDPEKCQNGFENLLEFSALSRAKITLLCKYLPTGGFLNARDVLQYGEIPFYEPSVMLGATSKLKIIAAWMKTAQDLGQHIDLQLDKSPLDFADSIMKHQKATDPQLIAVDPSSYSSLPFEHALRKVIKTSSCPIWMLFPMSLRAGSETLRIFQSRMGRA